MSDNFSQAQQDEYAMNDSFQRRLRGDAPLAEPVQQAAGKEVYLPYGVGEARGEEGLTFYHADGAITVKFYAHLTDIICTGPEYLTLIFMDCVYTLMGRNLQELIPLVKRHKLDTVQCYDAERFIEQLQGAVIYSIIRESHEDIAENLREAARSARNG